MTYTGSVLRLRAALLLAPLATGCFTYFDPARLDGSSRDASTADGSRLDAGNVDAAVLGPCGPVSPWVEGMDVVTAHPAGTLPARGEFFRDSVLGTCLARLTDSMADTGGNAAVDAPRDRIISIDGGEALVSFAFGFFERYDLDPPSHLGPVNVLHYSAQPVFDLGTDSVYYHGRFDMRSLNLGTGVDALVFDALPHVTMPPADETRFAEIPHSSDGNIWAFFVRDVNVQIGLLVWNRDADTVSSITAGTFDNAGVSVSGRYVVIQSRDTFSVYPANLSGTPATLMANADGLGPMDWTLARLPNGHDALVWVEPPRLRAFDLDEDPPLDIANVPLVPNPLGSYERFDAKLSGAGIDRPGWVVLSAGECVRWEDGMACPSGTQWTEDRIALVELTGTHRVLNLAFHHSTRGGESFFPRAIASRDLTRILFSSDWGDTSLEPSMYVIHLPPEALPDAAP